MKYGRRAVRCSGAVELVVFAGGEEEMGVPCGGGNRKLPKQPPTYHVDEGGIVTVVLRAPRTKGEFRMPKTRWRKFKKETGDFAARGIVRIQFQLILDRASGKV